MKTLKVVLIGTLIVSMVGYFAVTAVAGEKIMQKVAATVDNLSVTGNVSYNNSGQSAAKLTAHLQVEGDDGKLMITGIAVNNAQGYNGNVSVHFIGLGANADPSVLPPGAYVSAASKGYTDAVAAITEKASDKATLATLGESFVDIVNADPEIAESGATFGAPPCEQTLAYMGLTFNFSAPGTQPGTLDLIVYFTPQTITLMHSLVVRDVNSYPLIKYSSEGVIQDILGALRLKAVMLFPTPIPALGECVYIGDFDASVLGWDTWIATLVIGQQSIILYE